MLYVPSIWIVHVCLGKSKISSLCHFGGLSKIQRLCSKKNWRFFFPIARKEIVSVHTTNTFVHQIICQVLLLECEFCFLMTNSGMKNSLFFTIFFTSTQTRSAIAFTSVQKLQQHFAYLPYKYNLLSISHHWDFYNFVNHLNFT